MIELLVAITVVNFFAIAGVIAYCFLIRRYSVFHPICLYSVAHFFSFVLPTIGLLILENISNQQAHNYFASNVIMLISLFIFILTFNSGIGRALIPPLPAFSNQWKVKRLYIMIMVYTIASITALMVAMGNMGGILLYILNVGNKTAFAAGEGALLEFFNFCLVANLIWYVSFLVRGKRIAILEKFLFGLHVLLIVVISLILGGRAGAVYILLGMVIAYDLYVKNIPYRLIIGTAIIAIIFIFVSGIYREQANSDDWLDKVTTDAAVRFVAGGFNFANGGDVVGRIVAAVPDKIDIQFGKTYVDIVYYLLPSILVNEKPPTAPAVINDLFPESAYDSPTISPTMLGEAYINFAIVGVFIVPFLFGIFASAIYIYIIRNKDRGGAIVIGVLAILFIWGFPITNFIDGAKVFIVKLVPALLAIWWIQVKCDAARRA